MEYTFGCCCNSRGKMISSGIDTVFEFLVRHSQEHFDRWFNLWVFHPEKRSGIKILILESRAQNWEITDK